MKTEPRIAIVEESTRGRDETATRPSERSIRVATWSLAGVVAAAPLLIGGARPDHLLYLSFAALAVFSLSAWSRVGHRMRLPWPLWGILAVAMLGVLQLVPLPASVIAALSPTTHEVLTRSLGDLGLYGPGAGHALSLDPPLTTLAVIHQVAFLATAWAASEVPRGHRSRVEKALMYSAAGVAVIGVVHLTLGLTQIYGFYTPASGTILRGYFSTFVNNNTLASFLCLGALVAMGRAAETDDAQSRRRDLACAALCAAGVCFSASRGGQVALVAGLVVFTLLAHFPAHEPDEPARARAHTLSRLGLLLGVVALGLSMVLLPDWSATAWQDLGAENKFAAWPAAVDHAFAFPATGSGRGTFGVSHPLFQTLPLASQISHPENVVLQLFSEWGVLGALLALGAGLGGWFVAARGPGRETRPRHWGLLAGLAAVGVGQLADFGLEAGGLSLPTAAAFGLCLSRSRTRRGTRPWQRRLPLVAAITTLVVLAAVTWKGPQALAALPDRAIDRVTQAPPATAEIEVAATAVVADHPADTYLALKTAQRLIEAPNPDLARITRWLNRALFLAPNAGEPRQVAARALVQHGRQAQAADEYRAAMERMPWDRNVLVREVAGRFREPQLLARAIAPTPEHRRLLGQLLLNQGPPAHALEVVRVLQQEAPEDMDLWSLSGRACVALRDAACVRTSAERLESGGRPLIAAALRARLALQEGDPAAARAQLTGVRALGARDRDFQRAAVRLYLDLGDLPAAREALDRLWPLVALEPRQAAAALGQRGTVELRLGDAEQALHAFERAWRLSAKPAYARGLRAAAEKLGRPQLAERVLGEALPNVPGDDEPEPAAPD